MVQGADSLHARFNAIPERVKDVLEAEMESLAENLCAQMRRVVPIDKGVLRDSIGWTWGKKPPGTLTIGTFKGKEYGALRIIVYAGGKTSSGDAFYARFQEFGTVKMPAQPFFFPVYRANRDRIRQRLLNKVRTTVKGL